MYTFSLKSLELLIINISVKKKILFHNIVISFLEMLQKLEALNNTNSVNGFDDDVCILSLEKQNEDMLDGIN